MRAVEDVSGVLRDFWVRHSTIETSSSVGWSVGLLVGHARVENFEKKQK